jgi:hypothetical protein
VDCGMVEGISGREQKLANWATSSHSVTVSLTEVLHFLRP